MGSRASASTAWRSPTPDAVDEAVSRHHLVRSVEQNRDKRALLWPAERKLATAVPHRDRPENPELHSM